MGGGRKQNANSERGVFMSLATGMALFFSAGAVCTDLFLEKVPNRWIALGLAAGVGCQGFLHGARGMPVYLGGVFLPAVLLFPLFCFRMMGAGDIKLMAVMGGFLGSSGIIKGMFCVFLLGAVLSLAFLISCGNLQERFSYFFHYLKICKKKRCPVPYMRKDSKEENLHFTVPILLGIMLYAGGFC